MECCANTCFMACLIWCSIYAADSSICVWNKMNEYHLIQFYRIHQIGKGSIKIEIYYSSNVIHMTFIHIKSLTHAACILLIVWLCMHILHVAEIGRQQVSLAVIVEWIISLDQPLLLSFRINLKYVHQSLLYSQFNPILMWCSTLMQVNYDKM